MNGIPVLHVEADCIARAKRLLGYDVRFCMGTDEHSINVKKKAVEEGLPLFVSAEPTFDIVGKLYGLGLRGQGT